jgi:hypothetical protein
LAETARERGRAVALREDLSGRQCDETLHGGDHHSMTERRNIAASVRQRLLNASRARREDFQVTLTLYALERLLYRLSKSAHRDQFIIKGAMLFSAWNEVPHRPTRDLAC